MWLSHETAVAGRVPAGTDRAWTKSRAPVMLRACAFCGICGRFRFVVWDAPRVQIKGALWLVIGASAACGAAIALIATGRDWWLSLTVAAMVLLVAGQSQRGT